MTPNHCEFGAQRAKPPRPSGRPTAMHSHAGSLDIDTLDAALDFISHYELPADAQHEEGGAGHPAISEHAPIDLTARFQFHRAHSLEPPGEFDAADISAHAAAGDSMLEELFHPIGAVDAHSVSQVPVMSPRIQASLVPVSTSPASLTSGSPGTNGIPRLHSTTSRLLKLARPKKAPPASRRQELAELQDTVKQLTEKLESLRASSSNSPTAEPLDYVSSLLDESDSVWEKLAARQLAARRQAEEENKQLWTTVDQQVRFAKNLKRKLRRHTKDDEIGRAFWLKRPKPLSPSTTNDIFRELERGLDELYVSVDKKLAEAEMHLLPCPGKKRQVKRDAVNELFIELIDSNPVPFGVRKTAKAAWVTIGERGLTDRYPQNMLSKSVEETDSTLAASYDFMASTNEIDTTVRAHRVARKYIEEDRSVIVCETVMEPHFPNGGAPLGLKFLESHILVVTPSNESEADSSDTSVIQSVMTITRLELGDEPAKRYRAAAFIDVAIDGWNRSKERDQQLIENLLMEDALGLS